jgi:DNA mismatch repair protein MutL
MNNELFILDQHAAHERILFDELMKNSCVSQELIVPVVYEAESNEEDDYIKKNIPALIKSGFRFKREGQVWLLEAVPAVLDGSKTSAVFEAIKARPESPDILREQIAQYACKAAIKEGDILDRQGAVELIKKALNVPVPRCPHGRPIWLKWNKTELYKLFGRIV